MIINDIYQQQVTFSPEDIEEKAFLEAKNIQFTREWFVWVLGEKQLFSQFLEYIRVCFNYFNLQNDQLATAQVLFYEEYELTEDMLTEALPAHHEYREQTRSFALQAFVHGARDSMNASNNQVMLPIDMYHHILHLYQSYFDIDNSPTDIDLDESIIFEINLNYTARTLSTTWLDHAIQCTLHALYFKVFPKFVAAVQDIIHQINVPLDFYKSNARCASPLPSEASHSLRRSKESFTDMYRLYSSEPSIYSPQMLQLNCSIESFKDSSDSLWKLYSKSDSSLSNQKFENDMEVIFENYSNNVHAEPKNSLCSVKSPSLSNYTRTLYFDSSGLSSINKLV